MDERNRSSIDYINARINDKEVDPPKTLFKYRPFDQYAFEMLEEEYLFLCKACKLDDPSECTTTFKPEDYVDVNTGRMSFRVIDEMLKYYRPFVKKDNLKKIRSMVFQTMTPDGYIDKSLLSKAVIKMKGLASKDDLFLLTNFLSTIPDLFSRPDVRENIEELFSVALQAKETMGVCSFTEIADSSEMWKNYAGDCTGYCVQYSTAGYCDNINLLPVVYSDDRNTEIVSSILRTYFGSLLVGLTYGTVRIDQSHYFRLFLTKNTEWAYQKEWRLIGEADERVKAPKVEAIILGLNVSVDNKKLMEQFCREKGIALIQK